MGQKPRQLQPALSAGHLFGARLRQRRADAGLSQQKLGRLVHISGDLIGKIEKGERRANRDLARRCDSALGCAGALLQLWDRVEAEERGVRSPTGAIERETVLSCLPALRRVLDAYDLPDDGPAPTSDEVRRGVGRLVAMRLSSQYVGLAQELPETLQSYLRAYHSAVGQSRAELARHLTQAFRAADAIADKFGMYDLSARIIGMIGQVAAESGDEPTIAAAAYVRAEVFFANQDWQVGRRMLEQAAAYLPSGDGPMAASYGALQMRAAVLAARAGRPDQAGEHIAEATAAAAARTAEGVYAGTAFGPDSVRIHHVTLAVDAGDPAEALRLAAGWVPPLHVPPERRSHFFVDLADAQVRCGRHEEALTTLQTARRVAPQHVRYHPQVQATVRTLVQQATVSSALGELSRWTGVASGIRA
ncbi:helix-turn-helix transcriptional regulator [Polymorphospora sp. NPDC051019]|uniref:helix-turn-helix domain-containing protein n=1 Tax=Polymorphospora sp. NPDC051019 TaxID=3155725 RepID=UPI003443080A